MTKIVYDDVMGVLSNTPMTKEEITNLITPDMRYRCDKMAYSKKVYLALRQLRDDGKARLVYCIRNDIVTPCYVLADAPIEDCMTKQEQILSCMAPDTWYTTGDLTVAMYGYNRDSYPILHTRVGRNLCRLEDKGAVIHRMIPIRTVFRGELKQWRMVI